MAGFDLEVSPKEWVLPNRTSFIPWVYKTFHPSAYGRETDRLHSVGVPQEQREDSNFCSSAATKRAMEFFPHQRIIRDLLQLKSPYRGLLLYHQLGTGKSCSSIAAAEGFVGAHKKVIIMVPASLENNYRTEITRCASVGNPDLKLWCEIRIPTRDGPTRNALTDMLQNHYAVPKSQITHAISKAKGTMLLPFPAPAPADIPEKYVLRKKLAWNDLSESDRELASAALTAAIADRYHFVRYNGTPQKDLEALGSRPFDDAFIVMDEAHNFISRVMNGSTIATSIYKKMMDAKGAKLVLLTGTPIINHPFELCLLLNLVRGPMEFTEFTVNKTAPAIPSEQDIYDAIDASTPQLRKIVDNIHVNIPERKIHVSLLPAGFVFARKASSQVAIEYGDWGYSTRKEAMDALHAILIKTFRCSKVTKTIETLALPATKAEFGKWFLDESDRDHPVIQNPDLFIRRILGCVSYFRTAGEAFFPRELPRKVEYVPMSGYQFAKYVDVRDQERRMDRNMKRQAARGGLFGTTSTVYRAFSRMACNFVFPDDIDRPFPKKVRMRLERELDAVPEDDVADAVETKAEKEDDAAKKLAQKTKKAYDAALARALAALREESDNVLTLARLADTYSPKFAKMVKDIQDSPGSCLLYSQFRMVEGLGILGMALEASGFVEIRLEKSGGNWVFADAARVFSPEYNGKRYIVFSDDREKTDLLLRVFNSQWDSLPATLQAPLRAAAAQQPAKRPLNHYGDIARVMMITQSGAEGISLKNVRRVLVAEPFWNMVRINQVIGRAFRTCSHQDLPVADRDVQVIIYTASFPPELLRTNFTLQKLDASMTSDAHIWDTAHRKEEIVQKFMGLLKSAAIDCLSNSPDNKLTHPSQGGLQCYAFPVNVDPASPAFLPEIAEDENRRYDPNQIERRRKVKGRVVSRSGKKYILVDGMSGMYDYTAYKDAGVLVPVL